MSAAAELLASQSFKSCTRQICASLRLPIENVNSNTFALALATFRSGMHDCRCLFAVREEQDEVCRIDSDCGVPLVPGRQLYSESKMD